MVVLSCLTMSWVSKRKNLNNFCNKIFLKIVERERESVKLIITSILNGEHEIFGFKYYNWSDFGLNIFCVWSWYN